MVCACLILAGRLFQTSGTLLVNESMPGREEGQNGRRESHLHCNLGTNVFPLFPASTNREFTPFDHDVVRKAFARRATVRKSRSDSSEGSEPALWALAHGEIDEELHKFKKSSGWILGCRLEHACAVWEEKRQWQTLTVQMSLMC